MIKCILDEDLKVTTEIDGDKRTLLRELGIVIADIYLKYHIDKETMLELVDCVYTPVDDMLDDIFAKMPEIMAAAAMGDEEALKLTERFTDMIEKAKITLEKERGKTEE